MDAKKTAVKSDWDIQEMPKKTDTFVLNRTFDERQMEALRRGNVPQEMEDKWFWYMEGNRLYAHRSWTGVCVYIIDFSDDGNHRVTVNRDPEQYSCKSTEEDREMLDRLLDWWSQPVYDHYGEWISETADAVEKAKRKGREEKHGI